MRPDDPDDAGRPTPPKPVRPTPAGRPGGAPAPPRPIREVLDAARPTPVRDTLDTDTLSEPDQDSRTLTVGGTEWTVRVRGRGSAGTDTAPTPLLVLGFFEGPEAEMPVREALVVARGLGTLTERQLEGAWEVSRPPRPPGARDFFPDAASRGRKGDG